MFVFSGHSRDSMMYVLICFFPFFVVFVVSFGWQFLDFLLFFSGLVDESITIQNDCNIKIVSNLHFIFILIECFFLLNNWLDLIESTTTKMVMFRCLKHVDDGWRKEMIHPFKKKEFRSGLSLTCYYLKLFCYRLKIFNNNKKKVYPDFGCCSV